MADFKPTELQLDEAALILRAVLDIAPGRRLDALALAIRACIDLGLIGQRPPLARKWKK
jgi:hypothetical protein